MNFDDDETILFKHRATLKIGKDEKEGEVVATSKRLSWIPDDQSNQRFESAWANVGNIKYSPADDPKGRAMMMIQTLTAGSDTTAKTIKLSGSSSQNLRKELERLKEIISNIRKGTSTGSKGTYAPATAPSSSSSDSISGKKRSRTQQTIDRNSEQQRTTEAIAHQRKSLLEADRMLWKQYQEMVVVSKLLNDEEFWENRLSQNQVLSSSQKGSLSVMLTDQMTKNNMELNLTPEIKQEIFEMYPAVLTAFKEEVPLHKREEEFWIAYFRSEFFARDQGSGKGSNQLYGRTDDMFSRYDEAGSSSGSSSSSSSGRDGSRVTADVKQRNLRGLVGRDVDLTATIGDFGPRDSVGSTVDVPVSENDMDEFKSRSAKGKAIIAKYNRFSQTKQPLSSSAATSLREKVQRSEEGSELNIAPPAAYLPLHLGTSKEHGRSHDVVAADEGATEGAGAFAVSAFAVKKNLRPPPKPLQSATDILAHLETTAFGPAASTRATAYFHKDLSSIDNVTDFARKAAVLAGGANLGDAVAGVKGKATAPAGPNSVAGIETGPIRGPGQSFSPPSGLVDLTEDDGAEDPSAPQTTAAEGDELTEEFRQEMLEKFHMVTNFARHFYGQTRASPTPEVVEFAAKLVIKLKAYQEDLNTKRTIFQNQDNSGIRAPIRRRALASIAVIDEISKVVTRVEHRFEVYQSQA